MVLVILLVLAEGALIPRTFEGPSPPGYNLACSRTAISCRTCEMYLENHNQLEGKVVQVWQGKQTVGGSPHPGGRVGAQRPG